MEKAFDLSPKPLNFNIFYITIKQKANIVTIQLLGKTTTTTLDNNNLLLTRHFKHKPTNTTYILTIVIKDHNITIEIPNEENSLSKTTDLANKVVKTLTFGELSPKLQKVLILQQIYNISNKELRDIIVAVRSNKKILTEDELLQKDLEYEKHTRKVLLEELSK
jgi:hypothetical protein